MFTFHIQHKHKKARTGVLTTPHGKLQTPNLATVATHGTVRVLEAVDMKHANPDLLIANAFHLLVNNKVKEMKRAGGIHKWSKFKKPIMTDSGGFQVFSLGWGKLHNIGKVVKHAGKTTVRAKKAGERTGDVRMDDVGVTFYFNGKKYALTPERSMQIQRDIGADIIFAFDECTSPLHSYRYNKQSLARTHRWALRSLRAAEKSGKRKEERIKGKDFALFGIVQGSIFKDLRMKSSKFIGALPFEGFGIGGSFGEKDMKKVVSWAISGLPEGKPRHLLGIGTIKDILAAVKEGVDVFDCVIPTREARHAMLYTRAGRLSITKASYSNDRKKLDAECTCHACKRGITRKELRGLFKEDRLHAQRIATVHNIVFFKQFMAEIREAINKGALEKLEKAYPVRK